MIENARYGMGDEDFLLYMGLGFVMSAAVAWILSPLLSARFVKAYDGMKRHDQREWDSTVEGSIFALLVSCFAIYTFLFNASVRQEPVWGTSKLMERSNRYTIGRFGADAIRVLLTIKWPFAGQILMHHLVAMAFFLMAELSGSCYLFATYRTLHELSNLFGNGKVFMRLLGHKTTSRPFVVIGILFAASFFVTRILPLPYMTLLWIRAGDEQHYGFFYYLSLVTALIDTANVCWMYFIMKGIWKTLKEFRAVNEERR